MALKTKEDTKSDKNKDMENSYLQNMKQILDENPRLYAKLAKL